MIRPEKIPEGDNVTRRNSRWCRRIWAELDDPQRAAVMALGDALLHGWIGVATARMKPRSQLFEAFESLAKGGNGPAVLVQLNGPEGDQWFAPLPDGRTLIVWLWMNPEYLVNPRRSEG